MSLNMQSEKYGKIITVYHRHTQSKWIDLCSFNIAELKLRCNVFSDMDFRLFISQSVTN
jgi:hypothetical protein